MCNAYYILGTGRTFVIKESARNAGGDTPIPIYIYMYIHMYMYICSFLHIHTHMHVCLYMAPLKDMENICSMIFYDSGVGSIFREVIIQDSIILHCPKP